MITMEMIKAAKLVYEYFRRDEEGNVDAIQTALDQVDLDIKEGEFIVILGSNGSGKSTLARQMNAMLTPSEGYLWVDGKDVSDSDRTWDVRRSVGMVFQNPDNQIVADLVEEDVGFGPENIGIPTDEIWERVMDSLRSVGMLEYRTHSTNKLSGGEKQRVTIAGVLAMQPKCIVLDEPTAMLDPAGRKEVRAAVQELNQKKGITVLWITHFMEEAIGAARTAEADIFQIRTTKAVQAGCAADYPSGGRTAQRRHTAAKRNPNQAGIAARVTAAGTLRFVVWNERNRIFACRS